MTETQLSLRAIDKAYGGQPVLKSVSLDIAAGEFVALVGPSGCGKSTLLRAIAGLEAIDAGSVVIRDRDVTDLRAADRDLAMVFQSYALYPHLTARQNMMVPLVMRELSAWQRLPLVGRMMPGRAATLAGLNTRVATVAESLRITPLLDRKPAAMSGGQRQRIALGRAIVRQPLAFLMDEPLSNLDAALRVHTRAEIVDLHRSLGATTVYVTHDQEEALSMADRVAVMQGGRLLQVAPPRQIYQDPDHLDVATFIGSPRINLTAGDIDGRGLVRLAGQAILSGLTSHALQSLTLGFRPEDASFTARDGVGPTVALPFRFSRLEYLGSAAVAQGHLASGELALVRVEPDHSVPVAGTLTTIHVPVSRLMIFDAQGLRVRIPAERAVDIAREQTHG